MDIRTKLALALVSVSLLSMVSLGGFAYQVASGLLQEISERQLDALAESKMQDLEKVIEGWRDRVRLIRSRTQLRILLRDYAPGHDPSVAKRIARIVADAQRSTVHVQRIALFDADDSLVTSAGKADREPTPARIDDIDAVAYSGLFMDREGNPNIAFHSLMQLDGQRIGSVEVIFDAVDLVHLTRNYTGLGDTGESMVVARNESGGLTLLHSLRHASNGVVTATAPAYVRAAVSRTPQLFTEGTVDYRGRPVWAATRYLDEVDWGLVVKIDTEEEMRRANTLRESLIDLGLALGAFAIVGGTLLGFYLARPIRNLAQVVVRIRNGETDLRADPRADDEIGFLAEALNDFMDDMAQRSRSAPAAQDHDRNP